ncbi:MAG: hypothetical protein AB1489_06375 [Acidobacteriota bacterium]
MLRDQSGTTLLETLVAILILTVGLVALAQFVAYSSANDLRSRIRIEMAQLADQRMHQVRSKQFSDLGPPANFTDVYGKAAPLTGVLPTDTPEMVTSASGLLYRRWTYIWNPTGASNADLRQIVIIVQAASQGFAARELQRLTNYRTNLQSGPYFNPTATTP